jgi:SpoVK/Ycf46/Vps4 family AAA+-type ATPase
MGSMIKDRRNWVTNFKEKSNKIPEEIKPFYDRFKNELTPEEEEAKKLADIEAKIKKKKKEGSKKDKKKKGKVDDDEDDGGNYNVKIGGSEII